MEKENPFKQIALPSKEIPAVLKRKVMQSVSSVKLMMDIATLTTINYKNILDSLFLTKNKGNKSND